MLLFSFYICIAGCLIFDGFIFCFNVIEIKIFWLHFCRMDSGFGGILIPKNKL